MFWTTFAGVYDLFERIYNGKVYDNFGRNVASKIISSDDVLECACGTGIITERVAPVCKSIVATDYSEGMLKQVTKKCGKLSNVTIKEANIMELSYGDETFDKVIAGNVIHLLDNPKGAIEELLRVCKTGGKVIIPTYVTATKEGKRSFIIKVLEKMGASFKNDFTYDSYKEFFKKLGYENVEFELVEGRMPNAIAVITK